MEMTDAEIDEWAGCFENCLVSRKPVAIQMRGRSGVVVLTDLRERLI